MLSNEGSALRSKYQTLSPNSISLIARLSGSPGTTGKVTDTHKPVIQVGDLHVLTDLKSRLIEITCLAPQPRSYEFERFLKACSTQVV